MAEFFSAKRAALSNLQRENIERFQMRRRSRFKSRQETVAFERFRVEDEREYVRREHKGTGNASISIMYQGRPMRLKIRGKVPRELRGRMDQQTIRTEVRLTRTRLGYWYAFVQIEVPQTYIHSDGGAEATGPVCALDPGVRKFQSWYDSSGSCGDVGEFGPLEEILAKADGLQSEMTALRRGNSSYRQRRHLRRRFLRALERVRNRIADLQNKVASWLVHRFRLTLIPTFETSHMVQGRFLRHRTCRGMMTWSHYSFKQKLIQQAQKYKDAIVRIVSEAYTSKTCDRCGHIHRNLGGAVTFTCPSCGHRALRDLHAARNILLRNLPFILGW